MVAGIDESFDGVILIGYHSSTHNMEGVRAHTFSSAKLTKVAVNNIEVSEGMWVAMVAGHFNVPVIMISGDDIATSEVKDLGADAMVTPCPLCHLNLDGYQPKASAQAKRDIDLPILHLPQLIGLAMGISAKDLGLQKHIMSTKPLLTKLGL